MGKSTKIITLIISLISLPLIMNSDLSQEIIDTLMNDHERMKNFKTNYHRMSCKLLIVSKIRALFETEQIDDYVLRIFPEDRNSFLDKLYDTMMTKCLETYKEDKLLFEDKLFYYFPEPDHEYSGLYNINIEDVVKEFRPYTVVGKKNTKKGKKENRNRIKNEEDDKNDETKNDITYTKGNEEKVDL